MGGKRDGRDVSLNLDVSSPGRHFTAKGRINQDELNVGLANGTFRVKFECGAC